MAAQPQSYKIAGSHIVHDTFENEVVLLNFKTGIYYSLGETGIHIWDLIKEGVDSESIVQNLLLRYIADPDHIEEAVRKFIADLIAEGLIEPAGMTATAVPDNVSGLSEAGAEKAEFKPPALQKFTDIQEVILLDPIHDVNEMGWPYKKPDSDDSEKNNG